MPRKFLVIADDSAEFDAALAYACRRAASVDGRVALLRAVDQPVMEHWSGVREEIERQMREEAEAVLQTLGARVQELTGHPAELLIEQGDTRAAIRCAVAADPDIKILVLAASVGGRGPGPLVAALAKEGVTFAGRKLPVTVVPGDLTPDEVEALA